MKSDTCMVHCGDHTKIKTKIPVQKNPIGNKKKKKTQKQNDFEHQLARQLRGLMELRVP